MLESCTWDFLNELGYKSPLDLVDFVPEEDALERSLSKRSCLLDLLRISIDCTRFSICTWFHLRFIVFFLKFRVWNFSLWIVTHIFRQSFDNNRWLILMQKKIFPMIYLSKRSAENLRMIVTTNVIGIIFNFGITYFSNNFFLTFSSNFIVIVVILVIIRLFLRLPLSVQCFP